MEEEEPIVIEPGAAKAKEEEKKKPRTLEEKLEAAKLKVQQLQARKQLLENRERAKTNKIERAKETRRKILVGALVLSRVEKDEAIPAQLLDLTNNLTRDDDRALFGLPPLPYRES